LTVLLGIFLFFIRNKPQIQASNFLFCEILIFGAILAYISLYFWTVFNNTPFCNLEIWFFLCGFDISMGAFLAKNFRLYYQLFVSTKLVKMKKMPYVQLFLPIAVLLLIDTIVVIVWQAAFPIHVNQKIVKGREFFPGDDYMVCDSATTISNRPQIQTAFLATLGSVKAIPLIIGVWLSLVVRKAPSDYNESKFLAYAMYNQSFCLIVLLAIWLTIEDQNYNLKYILRSFVILWGITITLIVIFAPKIYFTIFNKIWVTKKSHMTTANSSGNNSVHTKDVEDEELKNNNPKILIETS